MSSGQAPATSGLIPLDQIFDYFSNIIFSLNNEKFIMVHLSTLGASMLSEIKFQSNSNEEDFNATSLSKEGEKIT